MLRTRAGACVRLSAVAAVMSAAFIAAPSASAHTGGSNCSGKLAEVGASIEGKCEFPFQGFPIGVAGVYEAGEPGRGSEIHVEVLAKVGLAPPRPLGVECLEESTGPVSRCIAEYNPFVAPITAIEPMPSQAVTLICEAHSHARYSRFALPSGRFACWSTDEGRADLEADGVMEEIGY